MKVIKRSGSKVDFESTKIYSAIANAAKEVFVLDDDLKRQLAELTTRIALTNSTLNQSRSQWFSLKQNNVFLRQVTFKSQNDTSRIDFNVIQNVMDTEIDQPCIYILKDQFNLSALKINYR